MNSSITDLSSAADTLGATLREWIGLAVISLVCLLYAMDLTVLNLAIPHISAELHPSGLQLLWILDIYGLVLAGSLITMGALAARIGRRRLLLIGATSFGAASLVAAFAADTATLIVARALLGIAAATFGPTTLSLIRNMFLRSDQRVLALSVWAASFSVGAIIGPLAAGVVLLHFWWGAVFLIAVPPMLLLLLLGPVFLPAGIGRKDAPLDIVSAVLSLFAMLFSVAGLKQIAANGWQWWSATIMAVGVAIAIVFIRRQRRLQHPLIDLRFVCTPAFAAPLLVYAIGTFVALGMSPLTAQYLQLVFALSPLDAGLWTLPVVVTSALGLCSFSDFRTNS